MYQQQSYGIAGVMPAALETGLFVSLATFQAPDGLLTGAGQPSGTYVNVAGYVDIPCMSAPSSNLRILAAEAKTIEEIQSTNDGHVLLGGYYPEIASHTDWRVIIGGVTYDVLGSESDSQSTQTRVRVQVATV